MALIMMSRLLLVVSVRREVKELFSVTMFSTRRRNKRGHCKRNMTDLLQSNEFFKQEVMTDEIFAKSIFLPKTFLFTGHHM